MAKLAGRGALGRWLCLFVIVAAPVLADSGQAVESVWNVDGTLKRGKCVAAITITGTGVTSVRTEKNPRRDKREIDHRITCVVDAQSPLQKCQSQAETICADGLYVYEVPEEKKSQVQNDLEVLSNPNLVLFINCLNRDPDLKWSATGKYPQWTKCQGGREMQFDRALVNSYIRIGITLVGAETRRMNEPWYDGNTMARDLARDRVMIKWNQNVKVDCQALSSSEEVSGIATSPNMCSSIAVTPPKREVSSVRMTSFCWLTGAKDLAVSMGNEPSLFFEEVKERNKTYRKGSLKLYEGENIIVTPLSRQEMYPFLGAFQPRYGPFYETSYTRYHVKLKNSKFFGTVNIKKKEEAWGADMITLECHCGKNFTKFESCIVGEDKKLVPVYVSARDTDQLKWIIYKLLESKPWHKIDEYYRFIIEGPWQPGSVFHPEGSMKRFTWIRTTFRYIRKFLFGTETKWPQTTLRLNPELFYSYQDLNPSVVRFKEEKGEFSFCYGKFQIRFNPSKWKMVGKWGHPDALQETDVFPGRENQLVLFVHDLVRSEFYRVGGRQFLRVGWRKSFQLGAKPTWLSQETYHKVVFSPYPNVKASQKSRAWWKCYQWKNEWFSMDGEVEFEFGYRDILKFRSTKIHVVS